MILLGSAILLVTTLQFLPGQGFERTSLAQQRVEQSLRVLNASAKVSLTIEAAETSERGYLLTADPRYLDSFVSALADQAGARTELRQLTRDSPGQRVRVSRLDELARARLQALAAIVAIYKKHGSASAVAEVSAGAGQRIMIQIRNVMAELDQAEYKLLHVWTEAVEVEATRLKWTLRIGGVSLIALLLVFAGVSERDIDQHQQAELALKASEEQFHTLANAIPQLSWIAHADGAIFWYNQRWYEFTGTTPGQMEGWGWQSVHHPDFLPDVMAAWQKSLAVGNRFEMIFPLRAADGSFHPFLTQVVPLRNPQGEIVRWFGTNTDITAQRATEDALRENQERLRLAQDVGQIGTFEWKLPAGPYEQTPELALMYRMALETTAETKTTWLDMICREDQERVRRQMDDAGRNGSFEAEWRLDWPDGEQRWHFGRARMFRDEAGQPTRLIGAIIDITDRKLAAEEVLQLNAQLEQRVQHRTIQLEAANKELAAFAYSVSHDLRAPLRGIDGWSLALLEDYGDKLDEGAHKYLNRVRSETQRMGNLIDDMLQLSRVTRDEMKMDPVDLTRLAQGITEELQEAEPERSMEFVIAPELRAEGDERLLEIALTNLFSNAVKFTGKREKAHIEFGKEDQLDQVAFYVRDNGAGFDMSYAHTLFGAFQRLHRNSEFPGTGIGLAIVQRVIGRHGGRIWADAQVDHGATFWFTLEVRA